MASPTIEFRARRSLAFWSCLAVSALPASAFAQQIFSQDSTHLNDVQGFELTPPAPALFQIPSFTNPGAFPTQARWTVADLNGDGKPEISLLFNGSLDVYTYDPIARTYTPRGSVVLGPFIDGRITSGDVDGDGRDEIVIAAFTNSAPKPRPAIGGSTDVTIVDFTSLSPLQATTHTLQQQFMTAHGQISVGDVDGDATAELLFLTQDATGVSAFNEPLGAATLYACTLDLSVSPIACHQVAQATIPPSPSGRFPFSAAAADFTGDGLNEVAIGYGTCCEATDSATVSLFHFDGFGFQLMTSTSLLSPFQRIAGANLDGGAKNQLVVTAGGQATLGGAIQVYELNAQNTAFTLITAASAGLPIGDPAATLPQEPPAVLGLAGKPRNDICDGIDNDGDGLIDENCLFRFLFIPDCYSGTDAQFRAEADRMFDTFLKSLGLDACPNNIYKEYVPQATLELDYCSGTDVRPSTLRAAYEDARLGTTAPDLEQFTAEVALTDQIDFNGTVAEVGEAGFSDFIWVKLLAAGSTSLSGRVNFPEYPMAHELGHLTGLDEEYCSASLNSVGVGPDSAVCNNAASINRHEARLGCDPTTCCSTVDGFCEGNVPQDGLGGRCFMSYGTAGAGPGVAPAHRGWCENCMRHLKQLQPTSGVPFHLLTAPLDCSAIYQGNIPVHVLKFGVSKQGNVHGLTDRFVPSARRTLGGPSTSGSLRLIVQNASGASIFESAFGVQPMPGLVEPPATVPEVSDALMELRVPVPSNVGPNDKLKVLVTSGATTTSRVTLNGSAPSANAGVDVTLECQSNQAASVTLNGQGSSDPDGDILHYAWSSTRASFNDATLPAPTATIAVGSATITLSVSDGMFQSSDSLNVLVRDTTPPAITVSDVSLAICSPEPTQVVLPAPAVSDCTPAASIAVSAQLVRVNGKQLATPVTINTSTRILTLPVGVSDIAWTATDLAGLTQTATQHVTITETDTAAACCTGTQTVLTGTNLPDIWLRPLNENSCIFGRGGIDTITTGSGNHLLSGGADNDLITSASTADICLGRDGNDHIHALAGASKTSGGAGNDDLDIDGGGVIWGNAGNDDISTLLGNSTIYPGAGKDNVHAGVGNDQVVIFDVCEVPFGEVLDGGFGNDTLRTPVPIATLLARGAIVVGFEQVIIDTSQRYLAECL